MKKYEEKEVEIDMKIKEIEDELLHAVSKSMLLNEVTYFCKLIKERLSKLDFNQKEGF